MKRIGLRLNFAKKIALAVTGMAAVAAPVAVGIINASFVRAQTAVARPEFEVASIRRSNTDCSGAGSFGRIMSPSPGRLTADCATVAGLIQQAYGRWANGRIADVSLPPPILGGPSWINSERYTIDAKAGSDAKRAMMNGPMLQALLENRFELKIHRQTRQVQSYALVVTKGGSKLKPSNGSCIPFDYEKFNYQKGPADIAPGPKPFCQMRIGGKGPNVRTIETPATTPAEFSRTLSNILGRPVIDKTGTTEKFDFYVEFAIDQSTPGFALDAPPSPQPEDIPSGPSIFTAVEEQLGLKLQSTKGPREFLVITHLERPSEN